MAEPDYDLSETPFLLARSYHAFRNFAERSLVDEGLSERIDAGTGGVFMTIAKAQGANVKEIVETLRLPNATITDILRKLERRNLIRRERDPNDGRAFRLFLSSEGEKLMPAMLSRHQTVMEKMHSGLSERESATLQRLLGKVLENISDSY